MVHNENPKIFNFGKDSKAAKCRDSLLYYAMYTVIFMVVIISVFKMYGSF